MSNWRDNPRSVILPDPNKTSPVGDGAETANPLERNVILKVRNGQDIDLVTDRPVADRPQQATWGFNTSPGDSVSIWSSPQFSKELERVGADRNIGLTEQGEIVENIFLRWLCTPTEEGGRGQKWVKNYTNAPDCQNDKKYRVSTNVRRANLDIRSDILENILNEYDSYTYHFRLYMMPEEASGSKVYRRESELPSITIAESGASTIGIEDVTIETTGGITKEAGVGTATKIMLTLKQPFGVSVLDKIKYAAEQLGIRNWQKAPYYLELTFRARDPETQKPLENGPLKNLIWEWPFFVGKTSIQVNTGGSTYIINGYHVGDLASSNEGSDLSQIISIRADKVGTFFEKLEDKLNEQEAGDQYYFHVDGAIANQSIILNDEAAANRTGDFEVEEKEDGKYITFTKHTSIDRIVDSILASTSMFQQSTGLVQPETSNEPNPDKNKTRVVRLWRVIPETTIIGYDGKVKNDYVHRFRYLIIPYETPTVLPTNQGNKPDSKDLALYMQRRGVLRKQYDYLYTGLNDQVLDFDVNFNFNWYAAIPYYEGLYTTGDVSLPGQANQSEGQPTPLAVESTLIDTREQWEINNEIAARGRSAAERRERITPDLLASQQAFALQDEQLQIRNATGPVRIDPRRPLGARVVTDSVETARQAVQAGRLSTEAGGNIPSPVGEENNPESVIDPVIVEPAKERVAQPLRTSYNPPDPTLSGDILVEDLAQQLDKPPLLIPSYRQETDGARATAENIGETNRAKTLLSTIFEQAVSPTAGDLLSIDLKVRGDPFWLEPSPYIRGTRPLTALEVELRKRGEAIDHKTGALVADDSLEVNDLEVNLEFAANTSDQAFYILRMYTPQEFDEDTGITTQNSQGNLLNGLYGVRWVVHEFSNGMFTQTLKSVRLLDVELTAELLEELTGGGSFADLSEEKINQLSNALNTAGPRDEVPEGVRMLESAPRTNISESDWRRLRAVGDTVQRLTGNTPPNTGP